MKHWFSLVALLAVILFSSNVLPENETPESLPDLIAEALNNNPAIKEAHNLWKASEYKIKEARGMPDPMANYSIFGESVETRVGPQKQKFGASQKIPFPGKLGLMGKAQSKQADMFREKYEAVVREVIKNIKFIYYDIFWVDQALRVTEEEKFLLESLEKVAQRRYESNLTPQQDVIKAEVELSKMIERILVLSQNRKSLTAKMNSVLNRLIYKELEIIDQVEPVEFTYTIEELNRFALNTNQELIASNLDIERAEYEKSLAKLGYMPDVTLGFEYIVVGKGHTNASDDGQDAWLGTIAINVPLWLDKLNAQVKEKNAALEAARKSHKNVENLISYEVEDLYVKITTYRDTIGLYKTALVPQATQSFEAAKKSYETGQVDFLNWLDAERVLLQTQLAYYKAIADYQKSIAYLERVVGKDL